MIGRDQRGGLNFDGSGRNAVEREVAAVLFKARQGSLDEWQRGFYLGMMGAWLIEALDDIEYPEKKCERLESMSKEMREVARDPS